MFSLLSRLVGGVSARNGERTLSDRLIGRLAKDRTFVEALAKSLMRTPTIWGDPSRVRIGENVALVNTLFNVSSGSISVGDDSLFGHNVMLLTGTHPTGGLGTERHDFPGDGRDIVIGSGVWIASGAIVLGPCRIGDRAVIAAGAVVRGDVEANAMYAGVPARKVGSV